MEPLIYLAFVDDWELRGDGSGDPRLLQFQPMRRLVEIYNAHGVRGSFNAEVLQQLVFREQQESHPELKQLADEWELLVRETFRQGHDIQLHIHPQWSEALYDKGRWQLNGGWSILNYSPAAARQMIEAGRKYLEELLQPINPNYRCISFRSGSWCIAPSPFILQVLADYGIVFDMSIIGGVRYDTRRIELDYTNCEEDFLPFYPVMTDARRVSPNPEPIVCIPTNQFYGSRGETFRRHSRKVLGKLKKKSEPATVDGATAASYDEWVQTSHNSMLTKFYDKAVRPYIRGRHMISDLAQLDYAAMRDMLASIRRRVKTAGIGPVPVILENHTKDIRDFSHIERFVAAVAQAPDICCVTLSEIAEKLSDGTFAVRTAQSK